MDSTPMLAASLMGNWSRLNWCFAKIGRLAWMTAPSDAYLLFRNGLVASNTATGISAWACASAVARCVRDSDLFMLWSFVLGSVVRGPVVLSPLDAAADARDLH